MKQAVPRSRVSTFQGADEVQLPTQIVISSSILQAPVSHMANNDITIKAIIFSSGKDTRAFEP